MHTSYTELHISQYKYPPKHLNIFKNMKTLAIGFVVEETWLPTSYGKGNCINRMNLPFNINSLTKH